ENARESGRQQRWLRIAGEAARQSGRADVPEVELPTPFAEAVAGIDGRKWAPQPSQPDAADAAATLKLLFWEEARTQRLHLPAARPARIVVCVGPEGGFTKEEVETARSAGFEVVGLGPRVLRSETGAIAALAIVGYLSTS